MLECGLRRISPWLFAACLFSGCASPELSVDSMTSMMPERSPELDQLNMLAGDWDIEGQVQFIGMAEPIKTTGTSHTRWELGGRFLMDHSDYDMGPMGPMKGLSVWGWDAQRKQYVFWWYDAFGESAEGTARYDEDATTWHITTHGHGARCSVKNQGTIRRIDDHTLAWTWTQWSVWGFLKFADMKGISHRR